MLAADDEIILENYVKSIGGIFRLAPDSVDKNKSGYCGLLLLTDTNVKADEASSPPHTAASASVGSPTTPTASRRKQFSSTNLGESSQAMSGDDLHSDGEDEGEDDDFYQNEEEIVHNLQAQYDELETEKRQLLVHNADLQKKAVVLYNREKMLQGSSTAAGANARNAANADPSHGDAANEGPDSLPPNLEKEKQYQDTLQLIIEERKKLNKQLKEFDQLALDLQTRLDDKEFKANSIASSFKQFKK